MFGVQLGAEPSAGIGVSLPPVVSPHDSLQLLAICLIYARALLELFYYVVAFCYQDVTVREIQYNTIQKKFIERYSREIESEALDDSEPY